MQQTFFKPNVDLDTVTVLGIDASLTGFAMYAGDGEPQVVKTAAGVTTYDRCATIRATLEQYVGARDRGRKWLVCVEAPVPPGPNKPGGFPVEAGWLLATVYRVAFEFIGRDRCGVIEVPPATIRRVVLGNGGFAKDQLSLIVFQQHGVSYPRDRGGNMRDAWLAWSYGRSWLRGETSVVSSARKPRGSKRS